jgi:glycerophosphoryl diester phosphodiesterase
MAELATAGLQARVTILSFDPRVLRLAHARYPLQRLCLLVEDGCPWLTSITELGFVPAVFGPSYETATAAAIQELRQAFATIHLVPWTVNDVPAMRQMRERGVDGITTDYPDLLLKELGYSVANHVL